jgi:hypothetical protein
MGASIAYLQNMWNIGPLITSLLVSFNNQDLR